MADINRRVSRYDLQKDGDKDLVDADKLATILNALIESNNQQETYVNSLQNKFTRVAGIVDDPL
jgi:hypothetical protein